MGLAQASLRPWWNPGVVDRSGSETSTDLPCDPGLDGLTCLFSQFKLNRSVCLAQHDDRSCCYAAALCNVAYPQANQITAAQLTVDREIEQR
jgi:hypothetical protein